MFLKKKKKKEQEKRKRGYDFPEICLNYKVLIITQN